MKSTLLAVSVAACIGISGSFTGDAQAAGFPPAPAQGKLGAMIVDPYGNTPLTALLDLNSKKPSNVTVTVQGKGRKGVDISYPVGKRTMNTHDGIPVFGLYPDYQNKVTLEYTLDGKRVKEHYKVVTGSVVNNYIDGRNITPLQQVNVKKVAKGFEDRLYLVNSHTYVPQGSDLHWSGRKGKHSGMMDATPAMGALPFENAPLTYVVDTQGEIRWWLNQDATFDGKDVDLNKRGNVMGLHDNGFGQMTFVQGQIYGTFDMLGNVDTQRLPRGYIDASHEHNIMPNGHSLVRAAKAAYTNAHGDVVHTVRDHILEIDSKGNLVEVWNLNEILDPYRDALLEALDMGAVCLNVDFDSIGKTAEMNIDAPYGDIAGIAPGRNWAHVNSVEYDPKDDSIILSFRHQGVAKVTRDKEVKWILAPSIGWNEALSKKLLKPVNKQGKPISCSERGVCDGDFDFTYTQHTAWLNNANGRLTVLDNGDGRHYEQPALPTDKYTRYVEYKIDENKMTVEQTWEYGKERGYEWYSPITSNVEYMADRNTMFGFGGSVGMFEPGKPTIGRINEIDYDTKEVKVEIDILSEKANTPHYRSVLINTKSLFGQ
ncbi:aryl-sulfate sulfotransferase [Shewanella sp. NIFS-20-20]|uniref:aryl-sulfate sulfotransferase n=1 Tax=Shewanella sp. NIFS-20-20 TaxID=2853806 RepID=UPI001C48C718|nr:aryl-sulfate sulfotransferase [Shewanella sp. NIFS-20-20]MBV7317457.1 aryl-sulfate sulfotransferase [Shewanella sp. NIFS-20-20]